MPQAIDTACQSLTAALRTCGVTGDDWRIYLLGYEVQIEKAGDHHAYVAVRLDEDADRRYALRLLEHEGTGTWFVAAGPFITDDPHTAAERVRALLEARTA